MAPQNNQRDREMREEDIVSAQDGVLRKVLDLYVKPTKDQYCGDRGITEMAKDVDYRVLPPRNKATVMILGNHSSGKSSFINWYIKENVLPTGAAVESRGFTLVSCSMKEAPPLKGEATLRYFPQLKKIECFGKGLLENLSTCVSVSQERCFPNVDFIDTPGLVDGNVEYPFDVNQVLLFLAKHVDLIFVFLDPHEQALGSRTMEVVKMLNEEYYDKMCYYLTKIDTLNSLSDLLKVSNQTTQNLALRVKNTHGWELPTIYLTDDNNPLDIDNEFRHMNMISKPCDKIELVVKQKIQDNLSVLEKDCSKVLDLTERILRDNLKRKERLQKVNRYLITSYITFTITFICLLLYLVINIYDSFASILPVSVLENLDKAHSFSVSYLPSFSTKRYTQIVVYFLLVSFIVVFILRLLCSFLKLLPKEKLGQLQQNRKNLKNMLTYREDLFNQYIRFFVVSFIKCCLWDSSSSPFSIIGLMK